MSEPIGLESDMSPADLQFLTPEDYFLNEINENPLGNLLICDSILEMFTYLLMLSLDNFDQFQDHREELLTLFVVQS